MCFVTATLVMIGMKYLPRLVKLFTSETDALSSVNKLMRSSAVTCMYPWFASLRTNPRGISYKSGIFPQEKK